VKRPAGIILAGSIYMLLSIMGIGHNLKRLRNNVNLTQEQVAAKLTLKGLPIDRSTYAHMERGNYNIRVTELLALKEVFGVKSFDEFFEGLSLDNTSQGYG